MHLIGTATYLKTPAAQAWLDSHRSELLPSGLEEQRVAITKAQEFVNSFESVSPPDSQAVVVIGQGLAQKFPGLQVYAAIWNRRIVIDRGDLYNTLIQASQRGNAVYFYGDPKRGQLLSTLAQRAGMQLSFVLRNPADDSADRLLFWQILTDLKIPSEVISTGLEEFTRNLKVVGEAA